MVAAYFAYQLIDLLFAAAVIAPVARRVDRGGRSLRRTLLLTIPIAGALLLLFALLCAAWLHEPFGALAWAWFGRAWSIRFLGVGAAAWGGLLLLPALAAWRAWHGHSGAAARGGTLLWLLASLALFAEMALLEPNRLVVERRDVALSDWPAGAPPLRIVVLADLQSPRFGAREARVIEFVRELAPDLIVLPGDLAAQSLDDGAALDCARRILRGSAVPLGTFAVNGDVDPLVAGGVADVVRETPARLLDNGAVRLVHPPATERRDVTPVQIELAGFDPADPARFAAALAMPPQAAVRIALVHQPEHVVRLGPAGFDLVIAGHTHGGQIVLPGIGPLVTLSPLPDAIDAGGLHRHSGTQLVVSRGIGCEAGFAPPLRLFCPPEITLITVSGPPAAPAEADSR
ncbi:MAG: hypothetical protein FJ293_08125 [Planctomycetes bacterium]|nr:hypothetical protein [Planctomycetota bacterium]